MKVVTANIIISTSEDAMTRFFATGTSAKNLIEEIQNNEDVLLFNNQANPNFISFKHSFGVESDDQVMTLQFIDPNNEFERRFLENKIEISNKRRFFYIAYGLGDKLESWSGPHKMLLYDADFSLDGERKVTIKLTPQLASLKPREVSPAVFAGIETTTLGLSQPINFKKIIGDDANKKIYSPVDYKIEKGGQYSFYKDIQNKLVGELSSFFEEVDFHYLVLDAFREYLKSALNTNNVVLLFPNLNILCAKLIAQMQATYALGQPVVSWGTREVIREALAQLTLSLFDNFGLENYNPLDYSVDNMKSDFTSGGFPAPAAGESEDVYSITQESELAEREAQQAYTIEKARRAQARQGRRLTKRQTAQITTDMELPLEEGVNKGSIKETEENICINTEYAASFALNNSQDHESRIKKFINAINGADYTQYRISLYAKSETSPYIINLWKELSKTSNIFGGYNEFEENEPVVVVGDENIIRTFLYNNNSSNPKSKYSPSYPIHPLDRSILDTEDYKSKLNFAAPLKYITSFDPFSTTSKTPEEFAYSDFTDEEKSYIAENNIPIFKYNTKNSNIKKLTLKNKGVYLNQLNLGFSNILERDDSGIIGGKLVNYNDPIASFEDAVRFVLLKGHSKDLDPSEKALIQKDLAKLISPELASQFSSTPKKLAAAAFKLLSILETENNKQYVLLKQFTPGNSFSVFLNMLTQLYKLSKQLSINTLPLFHVTKQGFLKQPCVVLAQDAPVLGSKLSTRSELNTFISGFYQILGFTHTISATNAESKFFLVKLISDEIL